jgi:hypothetical protein
MLSDDSVPDPKRLFQTAQLKIRLHFCQFFADVACEFPNLSAGGSGGSTSRP